MHTYCIYACTKNSAKGIDFDHNRFLILQREVESIWVTKPKVRMEHDTGVRDSARFKYKLMGFMVYF